jgi:hypothetical protein
MSRRVRKKKDRPCGARHGKKGSSHRQKTILAAQRRDVLIGEITNQFALVNNDPRQIHEVCRGSIYIQYPLNK